MSLAADTRDAVSERPFLRAALRAGIVNYTAAADWLVEDAAIGGDRDAVATALRRFADDLPTYDTEARRASVSMRSGVGLVDADSDRGSDGLLRVGDAAVVPDGSKTAIVATGDVDTQALTQILDRFAGAGIEADAAGVAADWLVVLVRRRDGATAVREVEDALDDVPV